MYMPEPVFAFAEDVESIKDDLPSLSRLSFLFSKNIFRCYKY